MLSLDTIRKNTEQVKANVVNRRFDPKKADIDRLLELDKLRAEKQVAVDNNNQERNQIANSMKGSKGAPPPEMIAKGKALKEAGIKFEEDLKAVEKELNEILLWVPNLALDGVPVGKSPDDNEEVKSWAPQTGYLPQDKLHKAEGSAEHLPQKGSNNDGDFAIMPHWEIGKKLGIIDLEAGAKVSGSRFYYLKNEGYMLMYGVFDLMIKKLVGDGFIPMYVPILVKDRALYGSSQFPADQDQIYKIEGDYVEEGQELYLVGSSEPSLFASQADNMLDRASLPEKMFALTACFRSEAGSWGKDVRGIKRVHQFDKLEMDVICEPDMNKAIEMHEYLLSINEWLLQLLEIPYHVINMCTADLGYAAAAKKYDVEAWLPSEKAFMEIMSDSITTDYQSRRLNIKCKDAAGNKEYVYTLNNTGATHRILIAIIEHYQQADGSIKVPTALKPYVGKDYIKR